MFAVVEADYGKRRRGPLSQKPQRLFHISFKSPSSESGWILTERKEASELRCYTIIEED